MRSILLGLLLASCATPVVWTKTGATEYDFQADKVRCLSLAYQAFPPPANNPSGYSTTCTGDSRYTQCQTQPSGPNVYFNPFGIQQQTQARESYALSCMRELGWSPSRP